MSFSYIYSEAGEKQQQQKTKTFGRLRDMRHHSHIAGFFFSREKSI